MKKFSRSDAGFTLVEMIITIAIMAVLAGIVGFSYSVIKSGRANDSAAKLLGRLDELQVEAMSKKDPVYLYLYNNASGIKTVLIPEKEDDYLSLYTYLSTHSGVKSSDIAGKNVTVTLTDTSGGTANLGNNSMLRIEVDRATGAYKASDTQKDPTTGDFTFKYNKVTFKGKSSLTFGVKMIKKTGKHYTTQ